MTKTWKESRPDVSLPSFSLPPLSYLPPESPKASLPCLPRTDTGVCRQPCCLSASSSWHPSMDKQPLLPPCLWAAHPTSLPLPATGSSAQLSSKITQWESHCMAFWLKNKAIRLGEVLARRLFYCHVQISQQCFYQFYWQAMSAILHSLITYRQ